MSSRLHGVRKERRSLTESKESQSARSLSIGSPIYRDSVSSVTLCSLYGHACPTYRNNPLAG